MGCSGGLKTPYEQCAILLREYELILRKRKDKFYSRKDNYKKLDKNAKEYKEKIYENLAKINNSVKSEIEVKKLKQLNELFQILLTEESQIYNDKKEEEKEDDQKELEKRKEVLVLNDNIYN